MLARSELRRGAETLAAAFDADPLFRWMLPHPERRRRWLEAIMAFSLADVLPDGCVFTPGPGPDAGVIGMVPPGRYPTPGSRGRRYWWTRDRPDVPWPTLRLVRAGLAALRDMARMHLAGPHYYLQVVGVSPAHTGRGLGRAMLEHALAMADGDGVPTYLETSNEANLGLYQKFGFAVVAELSTRGGGPPIWTMQRDPG